jgi:hypothetical protein
MDIANHCVVGGSPGSVLKADVSRPDIIRRCCDRLTVKPCLDCKPSEDVDVSCCFQEKTNSFRTGEAANSGLSRMQLGIVSFLCLGVLGFSRRKDSLSSGLPDEMVQPILALFQESRPEA